MILFIQIRSHPGRWNSNVYSMGPPWSILRRVFTFEKTFFTLFDSLYCRSHCCFVPHDIVWLVAGGWQVEIGNLQMSDSGTCEMRWLLGIILSKRPASNWSNGVCLDWKSLCAASSRSFCTSACSWPKWCHESLITDGRLGKEKHSIQSFNQNQITLQTACPASGAQNRLSTVRTGFLNK